MNAIAIVERKKCPQAFVRVRHRRGPLFEIESAHNACVRAELYFPEEGEALEGLWVMRLRFSAN